MNVRHTDHAETEEPAPTLLVVTTADVLQITRERIVTKVGKAAAKSVAGVRNSKSTDSKKHTPKINNEVRNRCNNLTCVRVTIPQFPNCALEELWTNVCFELLMI